MFHLLACCRLQAHAVGIQGAVSVVAHPSQRMGGSSLPARTTGSGEHGESHMEMIQMILAHAKEVRLMETLSCPSRGAPNPLALTWDLCSGVFPGVQDTSGMG